MDLERLRQILLDMHHSGRLSDIAPHLYDDTRKYVTKLKSDYYAMQNPLETRAGSLIIEEIGSVNDTVQEIFSLRTRQILDLAFQQIEGQYVEREEIRKMLPAEKAMFQQIVNAIESCRQVLISGEGRIRGDGDDEKETLDAALEAETDVPARRPAPSVLPYALVHVRSDMDSFMGVDGRVYRLKQGDIATLPERNADVLCERNIALNIRLNK
jgi:DNA replication factor GINS